MRRHEAWIPPTKREPKEGGTPMDISITPSSLQVKTPADCTELRLPAEVRLVPSSCRGLQYVAGDGLHLRLQVWAESNAKLISMFNQSSQARECCTFYCQSCGEVIIRDRKLLRVLPLPSENWGALVGEWCCHPDPFANKPLHPQENDCFIGDSFFLVNLRSDLWQPRPELAPVETHCLSSENHFKLKPKANTKVICKRCKVMLGETMSSETTKFYMTEIIIQPSERNFPIIPRSQFVQSVIAQCLVELSAARSTFRFTIQGHDSKVYILLWLLNSDSLVIESLGSSRGITKFPLLEDISKADSSSAWNAVKVLYQPCVKSRNEKLSSAWESDISIHTLTLPSATCLELLLILSRNNATLPPSLRYMNSFQRMESISQDLPSSYKEGSGMMGVESCVALGSSSLRDPDHEKTLADGPLEKRKRKKVGIFSGQPKLDFSAFLFLLYSPSGF
ncbi:E3 ubiquitin-protein ligase E3D isoform X2 [Acinonyx jubatus]|uniref:E3 ubiquitin-protein ligase E3D n=1 Tax=Acinonyx jubatus TaxID=32536 RepID=A0ABM3Q3J8_ACIJB|nr:E3 ubiquitin-protein ligase E3D isoform X2 [Acinonyx jubatus]